MFRGLVNGHNGEQHGGTGKPDDVNVAVNFTSGYTRRSKKVTLILTSF